MITISHEVDITGSVVALELVVPDNARSLVKPVLLIAQQGSQLSSYFSHITHETLNGEGYALLCESGIQKVDSALNLHYLIPVESPLFTEDGCLRLTLLNGFFCPFALFEALAHFTIQPFAKKNSFTMLELQDFHSPRSKAIVVLPTRSKKLRRDFVAVHQPFSLDPEDFMLLDFDPAADEIVSLPPKESSVSMDIN